MSELNKYIKEKQIIRCISSGVIATDGQAKITFVNPQCEQKLGIISKDLIGEKLEDTLSLFQPMVLTCLATGKPLLNQSISLNHGNLIVHVSPLFSGLDLVGTVCDFKEPDEFEVSARKSTSYRELNCQLKTIIASSSDGIWVCDGTGTIVSINSASESLNGIKAKEVIGKKIHQLLENGIFDASVTTKVLASGKQETIVQHIHKTDRILLCTGTPTRGEDGSIALIVVNERDMTELEDLRSKSKESQKLTEKFKEELSERTLRELEQNYIVADSNIMKQILQKSLKLSNIGASNILILGASGTGKGLLARYIHKNSSRRENPFIEINCAALPENLLEAELFGYEKGAFTGAADTGKVGLFELAQGGTLFLDEIGDMPLNLQTKLLKYLDDKSFRRLGGTESINVECATISATNRDLLKRVKNNEFREDLFYRLNSFTLEIPSLRDRADDIPGLIRFYLKRYNSKYSRSSHISPRTIVNLQKYSFPGNTRELKNIIENGVVLSEQSELDAFLLASIKISDGPHLASVDQSESFVQTDLNVNLDALERELLLRARQCCRTTREMAIYLNISQPSVVRKLKKHTL